MESKAVYFSTEEADRLRRVFYEEVLSQAPSRPEEDFRRITEAWLAATNADWVWLWLKNPHLEDAPWELRELACRDGHRSRYVLLPFAVPARNTVTEYCSLTGKPEVVSNIDEWKKPLDGVEYLVCCKEKLREFRCQSFVTVPFRSPTPDNLTSSNSRTGRLQIEGSICFHFCEGNQVVNHPVESLRLMGQLTALTIVNAFKTGQQDILFDLNYLAHDYLTRVTRTPNEDRQNYILEVIELLRKYLNIGAASVFYQDDPQFSEIRCLATTGISQSPPDSIPRERWSTIIYRLNEGFTGKCFATGEAVVLSADKAQSHCPRYFEVLGGEVSGQNDAVLFPIPRARSNTQTTNDSQPLACGVIRCSEHRTSMGNRATRPFDPVDLQTLAFIAQQIAPVIETLTVRIRREQTISIIKHDLLAPLVMIRDTAEEMVAEADPGGVIKAKYYDVMNLGAAALVASGLVQQLDPDPGKIRIYSPERTLLERTIVARIKNMLGYYAEKENSMQIRFEGFRDIPPIWIDRELIERAIVNLLTNAIKYGAPSTRIEFIATTEPDTDCFRFDVINQGEGISNEDKDLVFERGYRSRSVIHKKMGIGLGLFIARAAIERHGGKLVLSSPRTPTVFSIYLPISLKRGRNG